MLGYFWAAVFGLLLIAVATPSFLLIRGGRSHPKFEQRSLWAWLALISLTLVFSWLTSCSPKALLLVAVAFAGAYPIYRASVASRSWPLKLGFGAVILVLADIGAWSAIHWYDMELRMPPENCAYLESLRPPHARTDAERAVSIGDNHLLGVYGYAFDVLGAPAVYQEGGGKKPVLTIPCTTDSPVSLRHGRLIEAARQYAKSYNARVLELRPEARR